MLLRFVVSNFLSIREELEFTMFPYTKLRGHTDHIYKTPKVDLLKASAIYGAKGSGKSNFVEALQYLQDIVLNENNRLKHRPTYFRLAKSTMSSPSKFEIEFKINSNYYSYGLSLFGSEILEEWLYSIAPNTGTEKLLFSRKKNEQDEIELDVAKKYRKTNKEEILIQLYAEEVLTHSTPFIHLVRNNDKYPELGEAYEWFFYKLRIVYPNSKIDSLNARFIENNRFRNFVNNIIPKLSTGISETKVQEYSLEEFFGKDKAIQERIKIDLSDEKKDIVIRNDRDEIFVSKKEDGEIVVTRIVTGHRGEGDTMYGFYLEEESDGTRRLFDLLPTIEMLTNEDVVCVIDEIGRSLHPSLLKELLSFLLRQKTKGQFIFTTHESNLLDLKLFRQDEIWFVEKDETGGTMMYSLSEFKPRYDLDIRKGYLTGRFGAIPFLNWEDAAEEQRV